MLKSIDDRELFARVEARALVLYGRDERHLAPEWLARPDIYCVAEENEAHALGDRRSLVAALACFPQAQWFLATVHEERVTRAVEIIDPASHLVSDENQLPLPAVWEVHSFILFALAEEAVILYSAPHEFRLIAGSNEFVGAYIRGSAEHPVEALKQWAHENAEAWAHNPQYLAVIKQNLDAALSQVKLPPRQ